MNLITGHYVALTRKGAFGDNVTFVLGPFITAALVAECGPTFVHWYRAKYPGDHEAVLEAVTYTAGRLPVGRCNADYGFDPFAGTGIPPLIT